MKSKHSQTKAQGETVEKGPVGTIEINDPTSNRGIQDYSKIIGDPNADQGDELFNYKEDEEEEDEKRK